MLFFNDIDAIMSVQQAGVAPKVLNWLLQRKKKRKEIGCVLIN